MAHGQVLEMDFFPGIDFFIVCRCKPIGLNWKLYLDVSGSTPSQAIREPKRPEFQPESGFPADLIFSKPNSQIVRGGGQFPQNLKLHET
jgi:hypothetical protein